MPDLTSIITPALLNEIFLAMMPWTRNQEISYSEISNISLPNAQICFPALKALAEVPGGLDAALKIDLVTEVLPPVDDVEFPIQAAGLILLLDQGARGSIRKNADPRYTFAYFLPLAQKLVRQLFEVPKEQNVFYAHRWIDVLGFSVVHFTFMWSYMVTPLLHSENTIDQLAQFSLHRDMRAWLKARTNRSDPFAERLEELRHDATALHTVLEEGPPPANELLPGLDRYPDAIDFIFWVFLIDDLHLPITEAFGHFPNLNSIMGRDNTNDEIVHLTKTDELNKKPRAEVIARIREDVLANRWTVFGAEI
ncbi:hypothetical protein HK100_008546 [Physocladia obscura]|uniref:Uncharacterized protein n=1 Tax=Physocladia obscura TaxID=109957 RepID=A0AAD5T6S9_9FUNG|nr:hypothetical protein HK100_008546 [Physocladia obscura]